MLTGEVDDGADGDARGVAQIDEELREALMLLVRHDLGAEQRDRVIGQVRVRRPHLGAVDEIAAVRLRGARADRREVRARVGLAHADGERQLAAHDARQDLLPLRLRAEAQQQRPALPVGHPVGAHRRAGGQQLLHHHVALEERALVAAVRLGPRHADPAARAHATRELAVEPAPRLRALDRRGAAEFLAEELAHLRAEALRLGRQVVEREAEEGRHGGEWTTMRARAQRGRARSRYRGGGADPGGGGGGGAPAGGGTLGGGGGAGVAGGGVLGAAAASGRQRNTIALMRSGTSIGNDSSAVSPPSRTILRRSSLNDSSSTVPSGVQPTGTFGSVVSRTRAMASRIASCAVARSAVSIRMRLARISATRPPTPSFDRCSPCFSRSPSVNAVERTPEKTLTALSETARPC